MYMNKIYRLDTVDQIPTLPKFPNKCIVVVGGCFDILHKGHIAFLEEAKKQGDLLVVLLESDARIKQSKGANRPVNTQSVRAGILATLSSVDIVVSLPDRMDDTSYDTVVLGIKPAIIATTKGDPGIHHKMRQAESVNGQVREVIERLPDHASSALARYIE